MKKTINCRITRVISILLFSCLFAVFGGSGVMADERTDSIDVYSNIYNASGVVNTEFKYEITPDASNPAGAVNEPSELSIVFDNAEPVNNLTTATGTISFAETSFAKYGVYKYIVSEVSGSNPDYNLSSEKYEIYVMNANDGMYVYQQAKNLDDETKGNINFNHEPEYSYITINLNVIGDAMDQREYFRFKVFVDTLCVGCSYDILGQDEYVNYNGETIKTSDNYLAYGTRGYGTRVQYAVQKDNKKSEFKYAVSDGDDAGRGNATYVASDLPNFVYMKHAQSVTVGLSKDDVSQIPVGTLVRVIGDENLSDRKWKMFIDGVETHEFERRVGENVDFDIVLVRNMLVPNTGVFTEALPFVLLIIVGTIGLVVILKTKAKNAK